MNNKNTACIERVFNEYVNGGKAVGAGVAVYKKGKEVFSYSTGFADREKGTKMGKDTIFRCFSMSKPITAVAVLILMERGIIDLFDPVSKYIPEYAGGHLGVNNKGEVTCYTGNMTIYNLMNMTSGLLYPDINDSTGKLMDDVFRKVDEDRANGIKVDTLEFVRRLATCPLDFRPGEHWKYGTSADVLGAVVEVASGMKFSEFLAKEIFEPLKMKDTGFFVPAKKKKRFAQIYNPDQNGYLMPGVNTHLGMTGYDSAPDFESGGAGLVSTIEDYSKFARMLAAGGEFDGVRILSENAVKFMRTPQLNETQYKDTNWDTLRGFSYGNLCRVLVDNSASGILAPLGCFGWDGWTGNYFLMDPTNDMVMIYVIQNYNGTDDVLIRKFINTVYGTF